jgi:hypothetical protein
MSLIEHSNDNNHFIPIVARLENKSSTIFGRIEKEGRNKIRLRNLTRREQSEINE